MLRISTSKRLVMGLNAGASLIFAAGLVVMVNYIAHKHSLRADLGRTRCFTLSGGTRRLLEKLEDDVDVMILAGRERARLRDAELLLSMYEHVSDKIRVEYIDPHRDPGRARELVLAHGLVEPDVVIMASGGRRRVVKLDDMFGRYIPTDEPAQAGGLSGFRGESEISSAIQCLVEIDRPVVYFLAGHGEARIDDYDQHFGYSMIARAMRGENITVTTLMLGETASVPPDCDALVIAGPRRALARAELDIVRSYLNDAGRMLLMLDAGFKTGLEELLADWGLEPGNDRVVGPSLTGRELVVTEYGEHDITRGMRNVRSILNMPQSVRLLAAEDSNNAASADRPAVTVLACSTESGWADMTPERSPAVFDPDVDLRGPVPVAVAVERGMLPHAGVGLRPTRMVVVGDSSMVSNAALLSGYNTDLFFNALNWLLEREQALGIETGKPAGKRVATTLGRAQAALWIMAAGLPAAACWLGLMVWIARWK